MSRTNSSSERRPRRTGYRFAVIAAAVAFAAVAALAIGGASTTTEPAPASGVDRSTAFGDADAAAVVAAWSRRQVGWVYVYGDGRVLLRPDSGRRISPDGGYMYGILERRLSPSGLQLVRAGAVDLEDVLVGGGLPVGAWGPSTQAQFWPTEYALCLLDTGAPSVAVREAGFLLDVREIHSRLPDTVQAILRDSAVQTFTDDFDDDGMDGAHSAPGPGVGCFVESRERMLDLWAQTRMSDGSDDRGVLRVGEPSFGVLTGTDGTEFFVIAIPILPHGGWVLWGG